jgi:hypothetical protein
MRQFGRVVLIIYGLVAAEPGSDSSKVSTSARRSL